MPSLASISASISKTSHLFLVASEGDFLSYFSFRLGDVASKREIGAEEEIEGADAEKGNHFPRRKQIDLLSFNLEPLTDTLQELNLRSNGYVGLPKQLEQRRFPRLVKLDLSSNPIGGK